MQIPENVLVASGVSKDDPPGSGHEQGGEGNHGFMGAVPGLARWRTVVAAICLVLLGAACGSREPSQQDMFTLFTTHRADFERLRQLVDEQPTIIDVYDYGDTFVGPKNGGKVGPITPTAARASEIHAIMRSNGVETLVNGGDDLILPLWCDCDFRHLGPGQASKGIAFLSRMPHRVVRSIDDPLKLPHPHEGKIYSRIEGPWYAWYDYGS